MSAELTPQQSKALDFKHSISLKANAGSGKTFVLAKRFLEIAVKEDIPIQRIAAITFTDKAAGELYKRIAEEIEFRLQNPDEVVNRIKLERIRRQLVSANISTIHSFCINLLKEFPVDAELDANFTPIDQNTASELLELAIEETLRKKLEDTVDEETKYLVRLFGSKAQLIKQLRLLINHRKIVLRLKDLIYKKEIEGIKKYFENTFNKYFTIIYLPMVDELVRNLSLINNAVTKVNPKSKFATLVSDSIREFEGIIEPELIINLIHRITDSICTKSFTLKKREYLVSEVSKSYANEIHTTEKIIGEFSKIHLDENKGKIYNQLAAAGKYLVNLFDDVELLYGNKKKELGYLDYEDILIKTKDLLQSEVAFEYLSEKYSYLMVDEYQDTNELQYEIFMPLLDYLKKGNLFVVGDEKQSIYRFRDAELGVFEQTNTDIANKYGKDFLLTLPDSFRMESAICLFTNKVFSNLFQNPNLLFNEVAYSDLVCAKPDPSSGEIKFLIACVKSELTETELIARQISVLKNLENQKINWEDIAILVRKRSYFSQIEKEFIKFEIPYKIIGGKGFYQRQSIYDIYNYFAFLLDNKNDAALAGILRSPFFSISDVELYDISLNYGKTFWGKMLNSISVSERIIFAIDRLQIDIDLAAGADISSLIRSIFENTNFIAVLASRPDGEQELANIEKLKKITNNFAQQGFKTLYDYVNFLDDSIRKLEDEAQAGLASQSNAVNILTLHQAKGLEFPVVFLFKCDEALSADQVKSKSIVVDKNLGLLTKVPLNGDYFGEYKSAPLLAVRDYTEYRKQIAEEKRLFYVGVTRAKDRLYLTATSKKNGDFNPNSFLGMLTGVFSFRPDESELRIEGELEFLIREDGTYKKLTQNQSTTIQIVHNIELPDNKDVKVSKSNTAREILTDKIKDTPKGEIISATKISSYSQCPFKYNLIYNYGYSELFSEFQSYGKKSSVRKHKTDFKKEDINGEVVLALSSRADVKGRIMHTALEREINIENMDEFIKSEIESSYLRFFDKTEDQGIFINDISKIMIDYYSSEQFKLLSNYSLFENEYCIYIEESSHFLFGILDKLITDGKNYIIVDYKTDDVSADSIVERSKHYFNQLIFYVYIVSKLYKEFDEIETRLVFLKFPDKAVVEKYDRVAVKKIGEQINSYIGGILSGEFTKNTIHCNECNFSVDNKCII